ncbi:MAG: T9SS type A sorting domain-containing protein, partial [Bacteroidota bacterium]
GDEKYVTVAKMEGQAHRNNQTETYRFTDRGLGITAREKYLRYRIKYFNSGKSGLYHPPVPKLVGGGINRLPKGVRKLLTNPRGQLQIKYALSSASNVKYQLFDVNRREVFSNYLANQSAGNYLKLLDLGRLPSGRYVLVIRANKKEIERYQVIKR